MAVPSRQFVGGALLIAAVVLYAPNAAGQEDERSRFDVARYTDPYVEPPGERDADATMVRGLRAVDLVVDRARAADTSLHVSMYARDLIRGPWVGLREREQYLPASLMKVAVLFHALARLESEPQLRATTMAYTPSTLPSADNMQDRPPEHRMVSGRRYRYDELVERMIIYSDNHAKDMVLSGTRIADLEEFMEVIGVRPGNAEGPATIDPRSYAVLFRILYHSSVFSRPLSEWALQLLTRAAYSGGIRDGLPDGVALAAKWGSHYDPGDRDAGLQMHDCGIVYAPDHPYVICIMTRTTEQSSDEMRTLVGRVARAFHDEIMR